MMTKQEMKKLKKGDLVYLPSEITLFKFDESEGWENDPFISQTLQTPKPMTTAFVGPNGGPGLCRVLYNGEIWTVEAHKIFLTGA